MEEFAISSEIEEAMAASLYSSSSSSYRSETESEPESEPEPKPTTFTDKIDAFTDDEFYNHFKLARSTVNFLISIYKTTAQNSTRQIQYVKRDIFAHLWYLTHFISYKELEAVFNIPPPNGQSIIRRVSHWLHSIGRNYVKWPTGPALATTTAKFENVIGMPGVIGAIDCTHITVKTPEAHPCWYYNRQHNCSIVLQAVVNAEYMFTDCFCGEPGSQSDHTILQRSPLYKNAENNINVLFPDDTFLLGDAAHAPTSWLVPPFKESNNLSEYESMFNFMHNETWIVVDDAFEMLKRRFQRITMFTEETDLRLITQIVISTCVLYNICIEKEDDFGVGGFSFWRRSEDHSDQNDRDDGTVNRRTTLFNHMNSLNLIENQIDDPNEM